MVKKFFKFFAPPDDWKIPVILIGGILVGLIVFVFHISNASSYLSEDPQTCINCHVMVPQYATWQRSSHKNVASCVDCHIPHDNVFHKYQFKMKDGMRHSAIFTIRGEPQVIRIKSEGAAVVQSNCVRCHSNVLQNTSIHQASYEDYVNGDAKLCWQCHREVPHGKVRSLSATPYAGNPKSESMWPTWLEKFVPLMNKNDKSQPGGIQ